MSTPQLTGPSQARDRRQPPRTAPPRDMFGGRPIGGLGMPTQKAKNFKGTLAGCSATCVRIAAGWS